MSSAERILRLFYDLSKEGGFVSKDDIMDEYGITDRQLRRDIEYIKDRILSPLLPDSDISISYRRVEGKTYYMMSGDVKAIEEIRTKSLMIDAFAHSASDPIRDILNGRSGPYSKFIKYLSAASELPDYSLFSSLLKVIEQKRRIKLTYRRIGKEPFTTTLEPLELINYSSLWYLRAFNVELKNLRTYSLSRIIKIEALDDKIAFIDYETLRKEDDSSYGIFSSSVEPEIYTIRFKGYPAFMVSNQLWHKDQVGCFIEEDVYELSLPAVNDTELIAKTLSFGENAWPVSPAKFVENYKERVREMARLRL